MTKLSPPVVRNIEWIVMRMHIATTPVELVRDLRFRMRDNAHWTKPLRKSAYRYAIRFHEQNRQMYRELSAGYFGTEA